MKLNFYQRIVLFYTIILIPFLIFHEKHLSIFAIAGLVIITVILSALYAGLSAYFINKLFSTEENIAFELLLTSIYLSVVYYSGFMDNSAGVVFLFLIFLILIILRILSLFIYYKIGLAGMMIMTVGLMSFQTLQGMETLTAYLIFQNKYQNTEIDMTAWNQKEKLFDNKNIPLQFELPDEFYFHNPKNIGIKNKIGMGRLAGIISTSETDPNRYPLIKFHYLPTKMYPMEPEKLKEEYSEYLEQLKHQGEIDELKELSDSPDRKWPGKFWMFYDTLQPRYSKIGYYTIQLEDQNTIVVQIIENLVKGQMHEDAIKAILDSIKTELKEIK